MSEVRVKDALTGGEKGSKPERFDLIPVEAMKEVARVYGYGAEKYALRNWELGYDWGLSIAAMERHIAQFKNRESFDVESGRHHLAHAAFHCLALMTWEANGMGTDSRTTLTEPVGLKLGGRIGGSALNRIIVPADAVVIDAKASARPCGCDPGCKPAYACEEHRG